MRYVFSEENDCKVNARSVFLKCNKLKCCNISIATIKPIQSFFSKYNNSYKLRNGFLSLPIRGGTAAGFELKQRFNDFYSRVKISHMVNAILKMLVLNVPTQNRNTLPWIPFKYSLKVTIGSSSNSQSKE